MQLSVPPSTSASQNWTWLGKGGLTSKIFNTLLLLKEPNIKSTSPAGTPYYWLIQSIKISMCFTCFALTVSHSVQFNYMYLGDLSPVPCIFLIKLCVVIWPTSLTCWVKSFWTYPVTLHRSNPSSFPAVCLPLHQHPHLSCWQKLSTGTWSQPALSAHCPGSLSRLTADGKWLSQCTWALTEVNMFSTANK